MKYQMYNLLIYWSGCKGPSCSRAMMMTDITTDDWSSPWCCMIISSGLPVGLAVTATCLPLIEPHYLFDFLKGNFVLYFFHFSQQQRCYLDLKRKTNRFVFMIIDKNVFQVRKWRTHVTGGVDIKKNPCAIWVKLVSINFVLASVQIQ